MEILINQDSNAACDLFNSIREEKWKRDYLSGK
jgi:hypothetical protein